MKVTDAVNLGKYPPFGLRNKNMESVDEDFLYHFGFGNKTMDIPKVFGDTKFVCTGGSPTRLKIYAEWFAKECKIPCSENLSKSDRFVLFKTGKVIWVNHGMGNPSLSIMLVEILKLLNHAKATDVKIIRLGTSGGVGVEPGTVIVSKNAINAELNEQYVQWIAGERVVRETYLDEGLRNDLIAMANEMKIPVDTGYTMCADDFYEGQMRLDGFFCEYKPDDKFAFLKKLHDKGVRNIEMESTCFSSMTLRAGCKGAVVCVTLLNRMKGDQIKLDHDKFLEFEERPFRIVTALMKRQLGY
ncbi:uridine phosphorylase [Ancylostoma duodenale]|uniref:Uridine phosphorylase n=1 Tax=Ancylostoma duodenale TaxID=51022 RepID=A0A0C2D9U4_9BILA|nr:uridine phosphorylase [Ancylostoma duodenale]